MTTETLALMLAGIMVVAALYSSVGHGGASGYLAVLSLTSLSQAQMSTSSLLLNLLVAGMSSYAFARAGYFSWRLLAPFLIGSLPFAFLGGALKVSDKVYFIVLGIVLLLAALRMAMPVKKAGEETQRPHPAAAIFSGSVIGLVSGIVGVGGGIFLSPLMILFRWATAKETAAASAMFILANSLAGLAGRFAKGGLELNGYVWVLAGAAFVGGVIGSYLGANRFAGVMIRRVLATVLVIAAVDKLLKAR